MMYGYFPILRNMACKKSSPLYNYPNSNTGDKIKTPFKRIYMYLIVIDMDGKRNNAKTAQRRPCNMVS